MDESVIISYKPLFYANAGYAVVPINDTLNLIKSFYESQDVEIYGCLWWKDDGHIRPAIVCDKAKEVYEHLLYWCEGKPDEWFHIEAEQYRKYYCINLMPDLAKSVERMNTNFGVRSEHYKILFKSLAVCAINGIEAPMPQPQHTINIGIIGKDYENEDLNILRNIKVVEPSEFTNRLLNDFITDTNSSVDAERN